MNSKQRKILYALLKGEKPPPLLNRYVAPLGQMDLIRITKTNRGGSAKEAELTEWGRIVVRDMWMRGEK